MGGIEWANACSHRAVSLDSTPADHPWILRADPGRRDAVSGHQPEEKDRLMSSITNVKRNVRLSSYAMAAAVAPVSVADVIHNTLGQS